MHPTHRRWYALAPASSIAVGALILWLCLDGFVNYDMSYALVWGSELADGHRPDYEAAFAPTPHPLTTALGFALAPLGAGAGSAAVVLGFLALSTLVYLVYRLGTEWFGRPAGALAATIVLTWGPTLSFGARAYADIPYLALVLGALVVESRRPRAGPAVLGLLAVAGLLRPEAWFFAAAYALYAARGATRTRAAQLLALAVAAPVAWLLSDLLLTGDPLHSLSWTQAAAESLGRARGVSALPDSLPGRLEAITGLPVLAGGAVGVLAFARRALLPVLALVAALAAAVVLTVAGMPVVMRYALLPATLVALFCAAAALGWRRSTREEPGRRVRSVAGVAVLTALAISAPGQLRGVAAVRGELAAQAAVRADLAHLAHSGVFVRTCAPVIVSTRKVVPLLALWLGRPPSDFSAGVPVAATRGYYVGPAVPATERTLLLASSDPPEPLSSAPAGYRPVARGRLWAVRGRC